MLISNALQKAINEQIGHELANSNQYLAIAAYFEKEGLFGLAKLYEKQADEERDHAKRFVKFVIDAGGHAEFPAVPAPTNQITSAEQAAQLALDHELETTKQIYALMALATEEKNYIAKHMLEWFVNEQLEEVSSADTRLALIRRSGPNILMMEAYLAHYDK